MVSFSYIVVRGWYKRLLFFFLLSFSYITTSVCENTKAQQYKRPLYPKHIRKPSDFHESTPSGFSGEYGRSCRRHHVFWMTADNRCFSWSPSRFNPVKPLLKRSLSLPSCNAGSVAVIWSNNSGQGRDISCVHHFCKLQKKKNTLYIPLMKRAYFYFYPVLLE